MMEDPGKVVYTQIMRDFEASWGDLFYPVAWSGWGERENFKADK